MLKSWDAIIIGGGAAGLMCASVLGQSGLSVLLVEHNKDLGRKILISGGGRCNFTNLYVDGDDYVSSNPHFFKSALSSYTANDFLSLVEAHGLQYFEKKSGQLFCQNSAKDIIHMLKKECLKGSVSLSLGKKIDRVNYVDGHYEVECRDEKSLAKNLIIATGGLSISQIGASDFGHRLATQFGHKLVERSPALVPFKYSGFSHLAGIALPCEISTGDRGLREDILFTHTGFSGPAVLKISLYWRKGDSVSINFLPEVDLEYLWKLQMKKNGGQKIVGFLKEFFPRKLVEHWLKACEISLNKNISELGANQRNMLISLISHFQFIPAKTEGYRKAEVTRGGVCVEKISSKTMESKVQKNLYFIGEVMDVTGQLGGFNFQWAWSSAVAAARGIIEREKNNL